MDGTELVNGGDHPALNFINTRTTPWGETFDLIATGASYLDWLVSTDLVDDAERRVIRKTFSAVELDGAAAEARELRSFVRKQVQSWSADDGTARVPQSTVSRFNEILARDTQYLALESTGTGSVALGARRHWSDVGQLAVLPIAAAADLFANGDPELVRRCDGLGCNLWFYDRTKSHRRRWCSMAVCGNRDKVKNHRARTQPVEAS